MPQSALDTDQCEQQHSSTSFTCTDALSAFHSAAKASTPDYIINLFSNWAFQEMYLRCCHEIYNTMS